MTSAVTPEKTALMRELIFFLEEPSAREMLKGLLPKLLPDHIHTKYVVFEGKQDLEKRLPIKLRAWQNSNAKFVVMRDQDSGDCVTIKQNLVQKCAEAGKPKALVRIACHELETFYLGDLNAVGQAFNNLKKITPRLKKKKFRDPDRLANPAQELKKLVPDYQKVDGSRKIGCLLDVENNSSKSFKALICGIQKLIT